ncbi:MAG: DUF4097 family beta strand repeat-containing protein [Prolixibacteraceae bacterium]
MKTQRIKLLLMAIFVVAFGTTRADYSQKVHKAWPNNKVKAMEVASKFGNINLLSDRDDSVTIDVRIEIEDMDTKKAESLANQIDFLFSLENGVLKVKTKFSDRFKTNIDFKIIYTINIPTDKDLSIENKFGDVTLGNLNANGYFDINYGNLYGQELKAPTGQKIKLKLKYGNANIESINRLNAELAYTKLNSGHIESAQFETQYSIVKTEKMGDIMVDSKYDNYAIDAINELKAESKFTNWTVGKLNTRLQIETQYGDVDIKEVNKNFDNIWIENAYGNIKLGISPDASYLLESESHFCDVKFPTANIITEIKENNYSTIKAVVGNPNPNSKVKIESRYGKVKLTL